MLDPDRDAPFAALVAAAPLRIAASAGPMRGQVVPRTGYLLFDDRQSARIPTCLRAAMRISRPLPAVPRESGTWGVIVRDISLRGLKFLLDDQLFPEEELCLWLPSIELTGAVARCRRLAAQCYEIGVRLDAALPPRLVKDLLREQRSA